MIIIDLCDIFIFDQNKTLFGEGVDGTQIPVCDMDRKYIRNVGIHVTNSI